MLSSSFYRAFKLLTSITLVRGSLDMNRPRFDDLPLHSGDPQASAWGLWGKDDELGNLNLLTAERVKQASLEIVHGETIALKLALLSNGFWAYNID